MSPWIDEWVLQKNGAIFVWDLWKPHHREQVPLEVIQARFPTISTPEVKRYTWYRNIKTPIPMKFSLPFCHRNQKSSEKHYIKYETHS